MPLLLPQQKPVISDQISIGSRPKARKPPPTLTANIQSATFITSGALRFAKPKDDASESKPKRAPKPKAKNDPKFVAAARELRDRWLEEVNAERYLPEASGKYEVSRRLPGSPMEAAFEIAGSTLTLPAPIAA